jgi:hypothetical protein
VENEGKWEGNGIFKVIVVEDANTLRARLLCTGTVFHLGQAKSMYIYTDVTEPESSRDISGRIGNRRYATTESCMRDPAFEKLKSIFGIFLTTCAMGLYQILAALRLAKP